MARATLKTNSTTQAVAEIGSPRRAAVDRAAVREQHGKDQTWNSGRAARCRCLRQIDRGSAEIVTDLRALRNAGHSLWHRHLARRPYQRALRRHLGRPVADEPGAGGQCRGSRCAGRGGRHAQALNEHLRDQGPVLPDRSRRRCEPRRHGGDARVGHQCGALRHHARECAVNLTAVMANGEIVRTARRAKKSSAGYDLTRLLVGSEGTLGVITEVGLRLYGIPESIAAGVCPFPSVDAACQAVIQTIQLGIPVARIELVDEVHVQAFNAYSKLDLQESRRRCSSSSTAPASDRASSRRCSARLPRNSAAGPSTGRPRRRTGRGCGRRAMTPSGRPRPLMPGKEAFATDVCVPISRLAECVNETQARPRTQRALRPDRRPCRRWQFPCRALLRPRRRRTRSNGSRASTSGSSIAPSRWRAPAPASMASAWARCKFLEAEHGRRASQVMRQIKRALDPKNILNPGKIIAL